GGHPVVEALAVEQENPAVLLLLRGQLVVGRAHGGRGQQQGETYGRQSHHQLTTTSFLASQRIVLLCRYDSTASLIATIVAAPSSASQWTWPPSRMTSMKLPTMSRRGFVFS